MHIGSLAYVSYASSSVFLVTLPTIFLECDYDVVSCSGASGRRRRGAWGICPLQFGQKYFSGKYYVKFGHFSGKNHVKLWHFVIFPANIINISGIWIISGKNHVKFGHF